MISKDLTFLMVEENSINKSKNQLIQKADLYLKSKGFEYRNGGEYILFLTKDVSCVDEAFIKINTAYKTAEWSIDNEIYGKYSKIDITKIGRVVLSLLKRIHKANNAIIEIYSAQKKLKQKYRLSDDDFINLLNVVNNIPKIKNFDSKAFFNGL